MSLVFVYGTLKQGFGNHRLLASSLYHGPHTTGHNHKMVSLGGFPGVVYGEGKTAIKGEVYEITDKVLGTLDSLEGYPNFYDKTKIFTMYGMADMYVLSDRFLAGLQKGHEEIQSGEWK